MLGHLCRDVLYHPHFRCDDGREQVWAAESRRNAEHEIPETVVSDNGPRYASQEFRKFTTDYSLERITSSP